MATLWSDFKYLFYTLFHPFDGFYEIRFRRKKNYLLVALIFILCGFVEILRIYYTGFVMRDWYVYSVNSITLFFSALFPYAVFAVSNWSVTTLFEGNGGFKDVLLVISYALMPKLILDIIRILLSNVVIIEEVAMVNALSVIGFLAFGFLIFVGLCVVHEYTALRNVATLLASAAAATIIIFIAIFYFTIIGKIIGFITTVVMEISKRRWLG